MELVRQAWLGVRGMGGVGWRNWVEQQVLGGGGMEEEVIYCPALSPREGRKQRLLIRARWQIT